MNFIKDIFRKKSPIENFLKEKVLFNDQSFDHFSLQQFKMLYIKEGFQQIEEHLLKQIQKSNYLIRSKLLILYFLLINWSKIGEIKHSLKNFLKV